MNTRGKFFSWFSKESSKCGSILAVDDDFAIRVILCNVLKRNFDITVVGNGIEALLWLKKGHSPDVIISDISMPRLNGFDFLESLSQSGLYNKTPVVILSGQEKSSVEAQVFNYSNPVTFIPKPFDPLKIESHITRIIERKGCLT